MLPQHHQIRWKVQQHLRLGRRPEQDDAKLSQIPEWLKLRSITVFHKKADILSLSPYLQSTTQKFETRLSLPLDSITKGITTQRDSKAILEIGAYRPKFLLSVSCIRDERCVLVRGQRRILSLINSEFERGDGQGFFENGAGFIGVTGSGSPANRAR